MTNLLRYSGILILVGMGLVSHVPARADDAELKVLLENDRVEVRQISWKPGEVRPAEAVSSRVVSVLEGGTLARLYPDGKSQEIVFKTGEVKWFEAATAAYALKNIGGSNVVLFAVILK